MGPTVLHPFIKRENRMKRPQPFLLPSSSVEIVFSPSPQLPYISLFSFSCMRFPPPHQFLPIFPSTSIALMHKNWRIVVVHPFRFCTHEEDCPTVYIRGPETMVEAKGGRSIILMRWWLLSPQRLQLRLPRVPYLPRRTNQHHRRLRSRASHHAQARLHRHRRPIGGLSSGCAARPT